MRICTLMAAIASMAWPCVSFAQHFTYDEQALVDEHVFGGLPSYDNLYVRHAYVMSYDEARRVPRWVAYRLTPEYRNTPPRNGRFSKFRDDPNLLNPVSDDDYTGYFQARGYARGHMVPYAILGGDRDDDGELAEADDYDELTVFEGNYMSNVVPQNHSGFNGSGGIWFKAERWLQDAIVDSQLRTVWEIAGTIFGPSRLDAIGPDGDIEVPPLFYKIVVSMPADELRPKVLAFLFPHHTRAHGEIEDYLVSVDLIEALSGLDFFRELDDTIEVEIEDRDTFENWSTF